MNILAKRLYGNNQIKENKVIQCVNGKIVTIKDFKNQSVDSTFDNLTAALFDTHINGGFKHYFTQFPTVETVKDIADASRETGTAYCLPTLITSSLENILKGIEAVRVYQSENSQGGVVGMHLEGPFLNVKKRGAHLAKYVRKPTDEELDTILKHGEGIIKLMTIAPENFTDSQLSKLIDSGIAISVGHSDATYAQAKHAFSKGIHLVTHLYNAMSGLHHREPGVVGAALEDELVYAPIILDGHHCDFGAAKVAYRAKKDKLFLISDALFLGEQVHSFNWGEFDATLKNGSYVNSEGNLAGGVISLPDCIRNAVNFVGIPLPEALEMSSSRAATAMKLENEVSQIKVGFPALFTSFSDDLTNFEVVGS
ncbi:MAG: N-acetylglucosamine-6-phosphate deacetylase [Spirosomataceae bacterium]